MAYKTKCGRWRVYRGRRISKRTGKSVPFYVYLSVLVWEEAYGPLPAGHQVHHKDKNVENDALENLQALPISVHRALHDAERKRFVAGFEVKRCTNCKRVLPVECFYFTSTPQSENPYRRSDCKKCNNEKSVINNRRRRQLMRCVSITA